MNEVMKPVFVPKSRRETIREKEMMELEEQKKAEKLKSLEDKRKQQTRCRRLIFLLICLQEEF
jgi:hypothetical protein